MQKFDNSFKFHIFTENGKHVKTVKDEREAKRITAKSGYYEVEKCKGRFHSQTKYNWGNYESNDC